MSGRLEEIPGDEAFPAYLASRIAEFYERSGVIALSDGAQGSITIGGAVSPAGGNFEEPVTQATLAVVGAFLGLSRERSDSRRYPAIDPLISWSKYVDTIGHELDHQVPEWSNMVKRADKILMQGNEIGRRMEVVGEEGTSIDDMQIFLKAELYDFSYLQQNAFDKEDAYCPLERQMSLFKLINKIFDKKFKFSSHDEAREFFLNLQNQIKNMNFMPNNSEKYRHAYQKIEETVELR
jgi:V/A-type H+-transporting ATPase subunit A